MLEIAQKRPSGAAGVLRAQKTMEGTYLGLTGHQD